MPKKAVGLFVFTNIGGLLFAVCQRRGKYDFKEGKVESWADLLQPTCHGKLIDSEDYLDALWREVEEELGDSGFLPEVDNDRLVLVVDQDVKTYALMVESSVVGDMQLHASTGGFKLISRQETDLIRCSRPEDKGGVPTGELVMFPDDLEGLKAAFLHFTPKQ